MNLTLHVWRQKNRTDAGHMETYRATEVSPDMSFLEMLDEVNQGLIEEGKEPIAFDSDCREGICGSCAMTIDGNPLTCKSALMALASISASWLDELNNVTISRS